MRYFKLENMRPCEYTTDHRIYALQIRTEDRTRWIVINYSCSYKWPDYGISDAIKHYLSEEGEQERYDSWYRAWCD